MDEVFDNIHSCNSNDLEDFLRLKLEMEPREDKYNEKKKESAKDVKLRYDKQKNIFSFGLEMAERNTTYVYKL